MTPAQVNVAILNAPAATGVTAIMPTRTPPTFTLVANGSSINLASSITSNSGFTSGLSTPITLTASVSPIGATGTVDFFDGNVKLGGSKRTTLGYRKF